MVPTYWRLKVTDVIGNPLFVMASFEAVAAWQSVRLLPHNDDKCSHYLVCF